ncbi:MAG: acyl-CoA thioesterase [Porticoccaceae bacterium]|nr:acyl-CoA thioesterase [Porticoccaceae bacterium]MEA3298925.1 acyl-CoA thioesterase [Pseudomonadota bacterium]HLS97213.1 acyl-CoA thioesterase [Porticoccaceae bacterium]
MPRDTNPHGDIFGGWLLSQMDLAGAVLARRLSKGRVATVAISEMAFLRPVPVGAVVSCYTSLLETGRSSMRINIEVWIETEGSGERAKVTEGDFVYVAISGEGTTRPMA